MKIVIRDEVRFGGVVRGKIVVRDRVRVKGWKNEGCYER